MSVRRWLADRLRAAPALLFPLRVETRWASDGLKIRWYPEESQLALDEDEAPSADGFARLATLQRRGFRMLALPERVALFTVGHFGGLEHLIDVPIPRSEQLRYRSVRGDGDEGDSPVRSRWVHDFNAAVDEGMGVLIDDADLLRRIGDAEWLLVCGIARRSAGRLGAVTAELHRALAAERDGVQLLAVGDATNHTPDDGAIDGPGRAVRAPRPSRTVPVEVRLPSPRWTPAAPSAIDVPHTVAIAGDADRLAHYGLYPDAPAAGGGGPRVELEQLVKVLLVGDDHAELSPRGHFPAIRIRDNPYGVVVTEPARWAYANLPYAVSVARGHARSTHRPEIEADRTVMHLDGRTRPLHAEDDHERLEAAIQQTPRGSNLVALDAATGQRLFATERLPPILVPDPHGPGARDQLLDLLDELAAIVENGLAPDMVRERLPGESWWAHARRRFVIWRARHLGRSPPPEVPVTQAGLVAGRELLGAALLRMRAHRVRWDGKVTGFVRAVKAVRACVADGHMSPAEVEALLVEALDAASSRLDVWFGLRAYRTLARRAGDPAAAHTGVFGWVERPMQLPAEVIPDPAAPGQAGPSIDPARNEYFQAPSIDQAKTVAGLRAIASFRGSAYQMNLSAERVQDALALADALRSGATVAQHLGAEAQALMHAYRADASPDADHILGPCVIPLRAAFRISAGPAPSPGMGDTLGWLDGEAFATASPDALVAALRTGMPGISEREVRRMYESPLRSIQNRLLSIKDAFADLAHAESAYQLVRGNLQRARLWLDVADGQALPPEPELVRTTRTGRKLTQRCCIVVPASDPSAPAHGSVRGLLEPGWESFCRLVVRQRFPVDRLPLVLRRLDGDTPPRYAPFADDARALGIGLLDLALDGPDHLRRLTRLLVVRELADDARRRPVLAALGLDPATPVVELADRVGLEPAPACTEVVRLYQKVGTLIRASLPLVPESDAPVHGDALSRQLAAVRTRAERLSSRIRELALPDTLDDWREWVRKDTADRLVLLAGLVGAAAADALARATENAAFARARNAGQARLTQWLALCDWIVDAGDIWVADRPGVGEAEATSGVRILRAGTTVTIERLERTPPGVVTTREPDRSTWIDVHRYLREVSRRVLTTYEVTAPTTDGDGALDSASGWPLFLTGFEAGAEQLLAALAGGAAVAVVDRKPRLAELVKTRFVRRRMGLWFALQTPRAAHDAYRTRYTPPPDDLGGRFAHAGYLHAFVPGGEDGPCSGFTVDTWTDVVPDASETSGVAVNYADAPRSEAPNALVLCAPPRAGWTDRKLARALINVLDAMRIRTVTASDLTGRRILDDLTGTPTASIDVDTTA